MERTLQLLYRGFPVETRYEIKEVRKYALKVISNSSEKLRMNFVKGKWKGQNDFEDLIDKFYPDMIFDEELMDYMWDEIIEILEDLGYKF